MAGVKGRSGRRPDAERQRCRALIAASIDDEGWKQIFAEIADRARAGSVSHCKLLLAYAFGDPAPEQAAGSLSEPIKLVEVIRAFQQLAGTVDGARLVNAARRDSKIARSPK